ncbi:MAG TPA: tetraacyldisaccharide 4'-kinase [Planctomycetota bacterium]|nr:tetraacyldisaccharide 4'-kinase [Planctomycetota bacterium]
MAGSVPESFFDSWMARALTPVSWVYGAAALARRRRLARSALSLSRPVVSVGNITCGGTGKTPVVEMIVRDLLVRGRRPAILSRGYGAPGPGAGNDELLVLEANLPGVPHLQGKDRREIGLRAIAEGADVLVLDDGFQHVRLHRDLDLVLIDALLPFGHGRVLPAGLLREPLEVLALADLIGITRSDQVDPILLSTLSSYLRNRFPGIPQILVETEPLEWVSLAGAREPAGALRGKPVLAFCGIGNPESFRRQLLSLGIEIRRLVCFRDHRRYTDADVERLSSDARSAGAELVVMTQKDAVKIAPSELTAGWLHLRVSSRIARGAEAYGAALDRVLGPSRRDAH